MPACFGLFFPPLWSCRVWLVLARPHVLRCWCFSVSFAAEEMLPVEASFWNRIVAFLSFKEKSESGSGSALVGAETSRTWMTRPSSVHVRLLGNLGVVCLWWKTGWFTQRLMRRERADTNAGESVRAEAMLAHFNPQIKSGAACLSPVFIRNGWKS